MPTLNWETARHEFDRDGSLRDLYAFETSDVDWDRFLRALRGWGFPVQFSIDGAPSEMPESARSAFEIRAQAAPLLVVDIGGIRLCCHFFTDEQLELDLDPSEVDSPSRLECLTAFMRRLGQALQRTVVLTPENCPESPFIRYDPRSNEASYHPSLEGAA